MSTRAQILITAVAQGGLVAVGLPVMSMPSLTEAGPVAPVRTLRVELVAGNRQVSASIDARDESQLLELLKGAQARSG